MSFSGAISFASYMNGSVWTAGPLTHAVIWLRSALLDWCSLRPPCSLGWHVVDGCARPGGAHTKSMCKSSVLVGARRLDRQLVTTLFVAAQGQQPVLVWCFSDSPVVCQLRHSENAGCLLRWTACTELIGRYAILSVADLPPMPVLSRADGSQAGLCLTSAVIPYKSKWQAHTGQMD